jgi:hypothetical protein
MRIFKKYRSVGDSGTLSSFVREASQSQRAWPIASVAALGRKMLSHRLLRGIKARVKAGWYDTHAMFE